MNIKQNNSKRFSFKLCISTLSIYVLSLMILPIHAEEQPLTVDVKKAAEDIKAVAAAISAFGLPDNLIEDPKVVVVEIPKNIKAAVEKEIVSKIEIKKVEIDLIATQVFRSPIYNVKPILGYIAVVDGEVLDLSYHGSSAILAGYLKLIRDDFVLDSEEKAKLLGSAFQPAFPFKRGKEFEVPIKLDKGWLLIRNKFFKNHSGLVFTTDEKGKITLVEYVLKINPKNYSYKPPTETTL